MRKFKNWLVREFLPAYAKQLLLDEVDKLKAETVELKKTIAEQNAYIDGLEAGIRAQRKIVINATREVSK
jgi:hypothetical protein